LAPFRDVEVDLQERVRVAVEHRRHPLLLEQLDILEPVDVLARRGRLEVDAVERRDVLLIREALAAQVLGVDREDLLRLARARLRLGAHRASSPAAAAFSGTAGSSSTGFSR